MKISIWGKTLSEIEEICCSLNFPKFRAKQIFQWLYQKNIYSFSEMTNLSKQNRETLNELYSLDRHKPLSCSESQDGTKKYLFEMAENFIETAYIPDQDRATLCVSSQGGCKRQCAFCMTGKQGLQGNLKVGEILDQVYSIPEWKKLTNIVFMGMGEPFDNYKSLIKVLDILTHPEAMAWSPKRITVSTVGVLPGIKNFIQDSKCHLALSLHNPFSRERQEIMPIEAQYPLEEILQLIKKEGNFKGQRRFSIEYILFENFNDTPKHAKELVRILSNIPLRVNLIAFHPVEGLKWKGSSRKRIETFQNILKSKGINTTIRRSRGLDIQAACGLLSTLEKVK